MNFVHADLSVLFTTRLLHKVQSLSPLESFHLQRLLFLIVHILPQIELPVVQWDRLVRPALNACCAPAQGGVYSWSEHGELHNMELSQAHDNHNVIHHVPAVYLAHLENYSAFFISYFLLIVIYYMATREL